MNNGLWIDLDITFCIYSKYQELMLNKKYYWASHLFFDLRVSTYYIEGLLHCLSKLHLHFHIYSNISGIPCCLCLHQNGQLAPPRCVGLGTIGGQWTDVESMAVLRRHAQ